MSAKSKGREAAAAGKIGNPYGNTGFLGIGRPSGGKQQSDYDEWEEGYADKKREMGKK